MLTSGQARLTVDELVDRARSLAVEVGARAGDAEAQRRVDPGIMARLREAELFHALQPLRFGGFELDFSAVVRVACELGRGCASTAWVADLAMMHQWLVANFPLEAQADVWGEDPGAIVFGSYTPVCEARPEGDGYRISGSWPFASGCDYGDWALLGARMPEAEGHHAAFLLVPKADYTIKDDWFTNALCATGSKSIVCDDVFVPGHRRLDLNAAKAGTSPGAAALDRPLYRLPMFACIPTAITSPALGALGGAIDAFVDMVSLRRTRAMAGGQAMSGFAGVQSRLAEAVAALDAARLVLLRDVAEIHAVVDGGGTVDMDMRLRNRMSHAYVVKLAVGAIDGLYGLTGVGGINVGSPIERAFRDIHAISHHISLNWDAGSTMFGKHLLGLEPHGQF